MQNNLVHMTLHTQCLTFSQLPDAPIQIEQPTIHPIWGDLPFDGFLSKWIIQSICQSAQKLTRTGTGKMHDSDLRLE